MEPGGIFDEDSSSDDDSNNNNSKDVTQNQTAVDYGSSEEEPAEESKDDTHKGTIEEDERDEDNKEENNDENKNVGEKVEDEKKSDSEQDDVEFDDKGAAIVGSAAPKKEKQKITKKLKNMTIVQSARPRSDVTLHITKLPNLVGIQPDAFGHDTYSPTTEENEYNGYVHNMIRWRYKKDESGTYVKNLQTGKIERESNARLVKWEDGSMSLHVGSETFICDQIPPPDNGKVGVSPGLKNGYLYLSQNATFQAEVDGVDKEEPGGTVLECMGQIVSKITPRPSSLQSESHKALTMAVRQRVMKRAKIVEFVTQEDPEKAKQDRIRQNSDLNKAKARKKSEPQYRGGRMQRGYLENEYDETNIRQLKGGLDTYDYDVSDDDDDDGAYRSSYNQNRGKILQRRMQQKQQEKDEESGSDDAEMGAEDSDDDEEEQVKHKSKAVKRKTIFDEESD